MNMNYVVSRRSDPAYALTEWVCAFCEPDTAEPGEDAKLRAEASLTTEATHNLPICESAGVVTAECVFGIATKYDIMGPTTKMIMSSMVGTAVVLDKSESGGAN
ncbi:hypothetical protein [Sedimentitalea sp.]|uniref:hypothetical protein n=1 Tax=Sedimentitalea sp. TaxID=2048915 RepID=UPI0032980DBD